VANSEAVRADVSQREHIAPERIRVIYNGVEIPPPMPAAEREAIRAGWGFGPDTVIVGSVANYKPRKGLETMLRVAAKLHQQVPELRMVLIGEGPERPQLERMIAELGLSEVVRLHGREPDARRLYGAFDMVAHASESEGLPNVLLEAAAAGRAIVATAAGGSSEVVLAGESGLIVPVGDEDGFAREMLRLVRDPALRERLGAAARERAATVFGMDRFVAQTAALYEELAERKGVRR
jgi:glycosyltransferase involved in cell wall biosynthesis